MLAIDACSAACVLIFGAGPGLALFYRWKGVEKSCGWTQRTMMHDLLQLGLEGLTDSKRVQEAEQVLIN